MRAKGRREKGKWTEIRIRAKQRSGGKPEARKESKWRERGSEKKRKGEWREL